TRPGGEAVARVAGAEDEGLGAAAFELFEVRRFERGVRVEDEDDGAVIPLPPGQRGGLELRRGELTAQEGREGVALDEEGERHGILVAAEAAAGVASNERAD